MRALLAAAVIVSAAPAAALELAFPVACSPGTDCVIQNYVDTDPGPEAVDYRCGHQTYDGHDGTDIRVPTLRAMAEGVAVLAAAEGEVAALRDGMDDISVNDIDPEAIAGRECGNGVVVTHADGWITQYCHLKQGSIAVRVGDRLAAGAPLGEIGLSGFTEFPHLHFEVRRGDVSFDPFTSRAIGGDAACAAAADPDAGLWDPVLLPGIAWRPAFVLNTGFADMPLDMDDVESGIFEDMRLTPQASALVFFGRAIGLEAGDVQRLVVTGPDGSVFAESEIEPLERPQAQFFAFAGKRLSDARWPAGTYAGRFSVIRDGEAIASGEASVTIP